MDKFIIEGPTPLRGTIRVSGSKNAALPLMAACLLTDAPCVLTNIPRLQDIRTFRDVIGGTGASVGFEDGANTLRLDASSLTRAEAPYDLVRKMRASFYMLGALAGRCGEAKVSLPGGCAWGPRPVDLHLKGLEAMGFELWQKAGYIHLKGAASLAPSSFTLEPSSVGATVNLLLAAVLRSEEFTLHNAAVEPDVVQLCKALISMGADIRGCGTRELVVRKVDRLGGLRFRNAPDRIEAGTFMIAAAMHPGSDVTVAGVDVAELGGFIQDFQQTGAVLEAVDSDEAKGAATKNGMPKDAAAEGVLPGSSASSTIRDLRVKAPERLRPLSVSTDVYPGFATDLQAQWATMMTQAEGVSNTIDTIYVDRFSYVPELARLGADIRVTHNRVTTAGPSKLSGATVMSTDLRASVSLVMAGMVAEGTTEVLRIYHLDRGYEDLETKLNAIGASIIRERQ